MNEINKLDLKGFITNAINEVFESMFTMKVEVDHSSEKANVDGKKIVGTVSMVGDVMGSVSIQVGHEFARLMTAAMLEMEPEEVEGDEEIRDVIGEISNMIGGNLKSRFCDNGLPCQLSIPSITSGRDFKIDAMDWVRLEYVIFRHKENVASVEVLLKQGK